ncbi:MAG: protein kinase domain-containing protein [Myxococcota bacterium]
MDGPAGATAPSSPVLYQFGHYLLDEEIARGGMARVYRARLRGLGGFEKPLVVKQILPELARDPRFVAMFVEEAKTLVQMSHPHIVPVYELGVIDGVYFLAMELVEGATLAEILRDGPLVAPLVAHLGLQVADALGYAHGRFGLVHRDVTPRNIMVDGSGHVRLLDFGIAAPVSTGTDAERVFGSPGYMSPEQARGEGLDARSDLFSLGCVLFEALSGQRAFPGGSRAEARQALLDAEGPRLQEDAAPDALRSLVHALLAPDADDRPASAAELGRSLRGWLATHHPEGVGAELGRRTEDARQREKPAPLRDRPPPSSSGSDGEVHTLASSVALEAALGRTGDATAPIAGRQPPKRSAGEGPPPRRRVAVAGTLAAVLSAAGLLAWGWAAERDAEGDTTGRETDPQPARRPPAAAPPPTEGPDRGAGEDAPATAEDAPATPASPANDGEETVRARDSATPARSTASRLTVNATPWATVALDGRPLGTTPRRGARIAAGEHVLELACPPLGREVRVPLHVKPGAPIRVLADLTVDPPDVRVE